MRCMKKMIALLGILMIMLCGCQTQGKTADIAATTLPVYEFTLHLCQGTDLTVAQLVTESVSCLHDYALNVGQVKTVEGARLVVISGAGLEEFMEDLKIEDVYQESPIKVRGWILKKKKEPTITTTQDTNLSKL